MKNFLKALFSEDSRVSAMRVMSMIALLTAVVIGLVGVSKTTVDWSGLALLCSTFLGAAFGGKALQKGMETKKL